MDEKRIIKKYIGRTSVVVMTIGLILLMGSIGCVFMALQANARNLPEPTCFDALEGELNSYSYLDVIGVSDWIYSYDKTIFTGFLENLYEEVSYEEFYRELSPAR